MFRVNSTMPVTADESLAANLIPVLEALQPLPRPPTEATRKGTAAMALGAESLTLRPVK